VSDLQIAPLRHALKQAAVTGTAGSLLLGAAVVGIAAPGATAAMRTAAPATTATTATSTAASAQGAPVTIHTQQVAAKKRKVDVKKEMRTAAAQKGKPYRYGAAGPSAFDCSGFTSYVLKKQGIKLPRTAAQQHGKTRWISHMKAKVGDLVFFYSSGRVTHVGILAGHMKMWAAPHSGTVVKLQKVYGHNWTIGRIA
jgi:cell wall-associated NlpC family hydrolase